MRAIILAAGIGYRLLPLTKDLPKCMVQVAGKTILQNAVDALVVNGVHDIVIVVGYKKERIKAFLFKTYEDTIKFTFIENDIYDQTNNIYSLWLARDFFDDDIILLESDIVFEEKIITNLLACEDNNIIVVDNHNEDSDGTVVRIDENCNVFHLMTKEHQQYPHDKEGLYKTVNIYKLSHDFLEHHFYPILKNYIDTHSFSKYYELILGLIIYLSPERLKAMPVDLLKWYEIDTYPDLDKATYLFSSPEQKIDIIENCFGGFWNYPGLTDFAYMRNGYFPPKEFLDGIKRHLGSLVSSYASCQKILNKKASMLEYLDESRFFLFNGSSQGIKFLSPLLGKVSIPAPTFQEYINAHNPDELNVHPLPVETFKIDVEQFSKQALKACSDSLIIVNPNNPTSLLIKKNELVNMLNEYASRFRYIVVDESFIDFAGSEHSVKACVEQFDNLVIVKSMGKAYGIAGLRLGYIYTRNPEIKDAYNRYIPIWNINSFSEFFIEEALKYREVYAESLTRIKIDRDDFEKRLDNIRFIKIFNAFGNFIMVEIRNESPFSALELKIKLFSEYSILVKDITGKLSPLYPDAKSKGFLRLAVLKKQENDLLINGLENILGKIDN